MKLSNFRSLFIVLLLSISTLMSAQDKELVKAEEKKKEKANNFVYEGNELLASDEFVSAEKEYRKAISKEETNVAGNYNLGNSYYEKGNFDEALFRQSEAAKNATTKTDKHRAFHNIGNILMQKKECKEAVEAFKNALRNDPTDDESRYNFALAKQCAEEQKDQQNDENDKDKDKDKEEEKKDDKKDGEDEKKDDQKDKGDSDKKDGEDDKEKDGKPDKKDGDQGKDKQEQPQQPKPQPGQLSPQQIKSLLEAMNNQEQKVQEKLNAEKQKGEKKKNEKDW